MIREPQRSTLFPYTTLSRSAGEQRREPPAEGVDLLGRAERRRQRHRQEQQRDDGDPGVEREPGGDQREVAAAQPGTHPADRKSTRLNSSHANISYAVFCLKK